MTESNQQTPDAQTATPAKSNYLLSVAGKKISYMAGKGAVALAGSAFATHLAYKYGLNITLPTLQASVAGATLMSLEWLHDFVKVKTGKSWL